MSTDVNKNSPIPIYYQIAEMLRGQIASGELKPGAQISTERELCEQHGVSRVTVRRAITFLINDGLLVAQPGKGTFVAEPKLSYEVFHLIGFTEKMMRQGKLIRSCVMEQSVVVPPKSVAASLQLGGADKAIKIVRLRLFQAEPLVLETVFVPYKICAGLEQEDLTGRSLYEILERQYQQKLQYARQWLEATIANDYEATTFGIGENTPMILLKGVTFTSQDRPIEDFTAVYRGDRFRFEFASPKNEPLIEMPRPQIVHLSWSPSS